MKTGARQPKAPLFDFDRLNTVRRERHMTASQLARACPNIRAEVINSVVNCSVPPSRRVHAAIETALGMTLTKGA